MFDAYQSRKYRLLVFVAAAFLLYQGYIVFSYSPVPRLRIVKSGYDWSTWKPFYPVDKIQKLPRTKARKLPPIQYYPYHLPKFDVAVQEKRRQEIRSVMLKSWNSYREHAWMKDELMPVTGGAKDTFGGWAATLVDGLDTLWVMGLKEEFHEAAQAAVTIDWSKVQGKSINIFETTIRYLGGLLAAYDVSNHQYPALLKKAVELGDMLYAGFDTPNHMPPFWLNFQRAKEGQQEADNRQPSASAATLSLEFTRLAQLTGQSKYYDAVARVTDKLYENQNKTLVPGMWPTFFDLKSGDFTYDNSFTLGALSDSMYEYILKMHLLLGAAEPKYEQMYRTTAETIREHLLFRPMTPQNHDILFSGRYIAHEDGPDQLDSEIEHLACFAGGMFAIGGKIFDIPEHVEIGARLTNGCIWAYNSFPTGIAPEISKLVVCESGDGCDWNQEKWENAVSHANNGIRVKIPEGFESARDPRYILRPEALESVFILFRITGDETYREHAWEMFQAIQRATSTEYGNAAIEDVTTTSPQHIDSMESFWLAETLKYLYLIFSPFDTISLDEYVFNTECHPFKRPLK